MISCDVICDLAIVYASGEASQATRQVVEEHLPRCPECRETLRQVQDAEGALAGLKAEAVPDDGRRFLVRLRQLLFAVGSSLLFIGGYVLAMIGRIFFRNSGIPVMQTAIPSLAPVWRLLGIAALVALILGWRQGILRLSGKGSRPVVAGALSAVLLVLFAFVAYAVISAGYLLETLLFGLLLTGAYILVVGWRQRRLDSTWRLLAAAVLLLTLVGAAYNAVLLGSTAGAMIAGILVLAALAVTGVRLPGLPNATWATLLILFLGAILLSGRIGFSIATLVEYSLSLAQPPDGMSVEQAAQPDLGPLGFGLEASRAITRVNDVGLDDGAEAIRSTYARADGHLFLTVIHFPQQQAAYETFATWLTTTPGAMWALDIPDRTMGRGRVAYGYDGAGQRAYAAWQSGRWAIIIEASGPYSQATPLSLQVKEILVNRYRTQPVTALGYAVLYHRPHPRHPPRNHPPMEAPASLPIPPHPLHPNRQSPMPTPVGPNLLELRSARLGPNLQLPNLP